MNRLRPLFAVYFAVVLPLAIDGTASEDVEPSDTAVVMAPYRVTAWNGWSLVFKYGPERRIREIVFRVEPRSQAANAGLRTGDLLVAYGGKPVIGLTSLEFVTLCRILDTRRNGEVRTMSYTILREGRRMDFTVIRPPIGKVEGLNPPNHPTEPSPTSGTSAAGHPPRQP